MSLRVAGGYAGAFDPRARAAAMHKLDPAVRRVTIWLGPRFYTVEPWVERRLPPGKSIRFTNYLVGLSNFASREDVEAKMKGYKGREE